MSPQGQVGAGKGVSAYDRGSLRGFGVRRRVDDGHSGRAGFACHGIAGGWFAIERQPQDLAERLVGILGRRHALPVANGEEEILAVGREGDLRAELSALASLAVAPDDLEPFEARRIVADLQLGAREREARTAGSPGSE